MTRLNVMLLLAVLVSALYLVNVQYQSRRLFTELDRAQSEARKLEVDAERLEVEKRSQATPLRVEKLAKDKLQMRTTSPATTLYIAPETSTVAPPKRTAMSSVTTLSGVTP